MNEEKFKAREVQPTVLRLGPELRAPRQTTNAPANEKSPAALGESDRAILQIFHALPYEKQLALLSLLK